MHKVRSSKTRKPVKTGDSVKVPVFRPLSRAPALFIWHVNLGLAPQALCLRLLSQAKKYHSISTFCAKPWVCVFRFRKGWVSVDGDRWGGVVVARTDCLRVLREFVAQRRK